MKLSVDLSLLLRAVEKMGAADIEFTIETNASPLEPIDIDLGKGVDLPLKDIDFSNGLASYKGRQVLLYIKDHSYRILNAINNPQKDGNKFHVADCEKLKAMRKINRFDRYVVTNNLKGIFTIAGTHPGTKQNISEDVSLSVCKCCLKYLNFHGYLLAENQQQRDNIFNAFSINDFFDTYSSCFTHLPSGVADVHDCGYPENWEIISQKYRTKVQYRCECCGVNLQSAEKLLHVHHKNGVKNDIRPENLLALCIDCHKKQPKHGHMRSDPSAIKKINELRREQRIIEITSWQDVFRYADTALHGLIGLLQKRYIRLPSVGMTLSSKNEQPIEIDLAWKNKKIGVAINPPSEAAAKALGWKIFSMSQCLDDIDSFVSKLQKRS